MSFLDKLKNVFFEEEEEEVEEIPKLARKVEVQKKQTIVPPIKEELKEVAFEKEISQEIQEVKLETKIDVKNDDNVVNETPSRFAMMFEEEDFVPEEPPKVSKTIKQEFVERRSLYPEKKEESYTDSIKKDTSYGYTKSYYEAKETKTFTPSPIISPIYGILDKNYKKEEVITRKEIKITSTRGKLDLDTVRSKAFGDNQEEEKVVTAVKPKPEKEEKIYDVNANKPSVKGVTLEAADEYYRDLGLAYNVDYSDRAKEQTKRENTGRLEDNLFDLIESMYDKED